MNTEELNEVWVEYKARPTEELLDFLVRQYAPLAGYLARRALAKAPPYQDAEDILSYAHHGLLDAIARFEPGRVKFETYATRRISGAIIDGQRQQDPLARSARRRVKLMQNAIAGLWETLDRDPSVEEIAEQMGESAETVRATMLAQKSLAGSLDVDNGVSDSLAMSGEAEVDAQLNEIRERVAQILARMPERSRAFVLAHYCGEQNLRTSGEALGMSNDWCRLTRRQVLTTLAKGA